MLLTTNIIQDSPHNKELFGPKCQSCQDWENTCICLYQGVGICIHTCMYFLPLSLLKGLRSKDIPVIMSIPSAHILVSNTYHAPLRTKACWEKELILELRQDRYIVNLEHLVILESKEVIPQNDRSIQKYQLRGLSRAKRGTIQVRKQWEQWCMINDGKYENSWVHINDEKTAGRGGSHL